MTINYDVFRTIKEHYENLSDGDKATMLTDLQETMQKELENNIIDEYEVKIGMEYFRKTVLVNFKDKVVAVIKKERFKEKVYNSLARVMLSPPNTMDLGDYVTIEENGIQETYISRSRVERNRTHDESNLLYCQHNVNILDDDGVTIHRYPMSFQDNKSRPNSNERADSGVTTNSTFQGYLKHDIISKRFLANTNINSSKSNKIDRILIDGVAYRINGDDGLSLPKILTLGLEKSEIDPINDNLELGIADYWNNVKTTPVVSEILGKDTIYITDKNTYSIVTNSVVTWNLINNLNGLTLELTENNNVCTIKCDYDTLLIV